MHRSHRRPNFFLCASRFTHTRLQDKVTCVSKGEVGVTSRSHCSLVPTQKKVHCVR